MRAVRYLYVVALAVAWSSTALAQTTTPGPPPASTTPTVAGPISTHFTASGFVGSNIGASGSDAVRNNSSVMFGGQFAAMYHGLIGAEFISDYNPSFKVQSFVLPNNSNLTTYMGNGIISLPFGSGGNWQPYASGGAGGVTMRAQILTDLSGTTASNTQTTWGWDAGGGLMGFVGKWGFRADGRWYRVNTKTLSGSPQDLVTQSLLSGLEFWRASVGVAYRW